MRRASIRRTSSIGRAVPLQWYNKRMPMPRKPRPQCIHCGEATSRPAQTYCSNKCQKAYERKQLALSGGLKEPRSIKRFLSDSRGHACSVCGTSDWRGQPLVLILDHIDGNASDNSISNMRLVCPNCDSQLPTFKGRNRGNGRHARRERYAAGKSF